MISVIQNIRRNLALRIAVSVAAAILVLGIFLYFLVLSTISGFVQSEIERDLQFLSHRIYNICNVSFDYILQSGYVNHPDRIVMKQALTLGEIEDFFRQENLEGLIYDIDGKVLLLETDLPLGAEKIMAEAAPGEKAVSLGDQARGYFAYHIDFMPWNWKIVLVKSEKEYADLIIQVKRVHFYTLILLLLATFLTSLFLYQSINRPINAIVGPIKNGRRPQYKGIDVFEFLNDTITTMMDSLQQSEEKYRSLVETTSDFVWEVDRRGFYTYASPKIKDILGYRPEEVIGKQPFDLMPPDEAQRVRKILGKIVTFETPFERLERANLHKGGGNVVLETSGIPILGSDGELLGYRGIDRDITERVRAEEESRKLEAQLQHAQRMQSIGTLAGGIAHNFNNLLMGIMGNASILLMNADPGHRDFKSLKTIEKLALDGSKLTARLLGYAREGKYVVSALDLNKLVLETSLTFRATRKEIRVRQELRDDLHVIEGDSGQIRQMLLDLYVNASEAMPGGGSLYLKTDNATHADMKAKTYVPKSGKYAMLTVQDNGVGMDEETIGRIFEPFFSTKNLSESKGLGLASVYGTVESHDGYVDVESEKDCGTTFRIYFPVAEKEVKEKTGPTCESDIAGKTILLVDDEDDVIDVGKRMLAVLGCEVILAKSGNEAIEIYEKKRDGIDMVILDMIMPEMGGGATYDKLKEINPEIKVLLASGYSVNGQAAEILERGCDGFVQKPFSVGDLSVKVGEILNEA